jgi:hypothetical protein
MGRGTRGSHGRHRRRAGAALGVALLVGSIVASSASAATPSVTITSPSAGATVEGTIPVAIAASVGGGDYVSSVRLYDGVEQVDYQSCQNQPTCVATIRWRATGLSGLHTLTARAYTGDNDFADSSPLLVTVVSPPPSVAIVTPAAGSTVKGTVLVTASAMTDASQDDYPTSIRFYDGVNSIDSISCQGQQTCQDSVSWPATGLSGRHTLTAVVFTDNGLSVRSVPVDVTVVTPAPHVRITSPASGTPLGRILTIHVVGSTDPALADYPTQLAVYDGRSELGSISCQGQQTCEGSVHWDARHAHGAHRLTAIVRTDDGHARRSAAVVVGAVAPTRPHPSCKLSTASARIGELVRGHCTMAGVPQGTRVLVQARGHRRWATVVTGKVGGRGHFEFRLRGARRATYDLWVAVSASRSTTSARAHIGTLHITG